MPLPSLYRLVPLPPSPPRYIDPPPPSALPSFTLQISTLNVWWSRSTRRSPKLSRTAERSSASASSGELSRSRGSSDDQRAEPQIYSYSLGGLIARYALGLLESRTPSFFTDIKPINFTTFASPAIGM